MQAAAPRTSCWLEPPPAVLSRFRVGRPLGAGGMARVYEAEDPCGRVALKVVDLRAGHQDSFMREAEIGALLTEPDLVGADEAGVAGPFGWMAMPLLEGVPLSKMQREPTFTFEERLRILIAVTEAVSRLHAHGVIHCDLKPGNVFITEQGEVKLIDFGISVYDGERRPVPTAITGTPKYMAPEMIVGVEIECRSDVFSLGTLAYRVLSGTTPWRRDSATALLFAIINDPPQAFADAARDAVPHVPPERMTALHEVVHRAISHDPEKRYPSAADLGRALAAAGLGGR